MSLRLVNANVVVVAGRFNPTILNQLWLVEHNLVGRDEFRSGCLFSDAIAHVNTDKFALLAAPEQLQFTPKLHPEDAQLVVREILGKIISLLPHTPYTAVGINFIWHLQPGNESIADYSRRNFFIGKHPLFAKFDDPSALFGTYMSKDALGCRLKLDIKPGVGAPDDPSNEVFQFACNFHLDLPGINGVELVQQMLSRWTEAYKLSKSLAESTGETANDA